MTDVASLAPHDIRPAVAGPSSNRGVWLFAAILVAAGGGLFYALQINRIDLADKGIVQEPAAGGMIASPPDLEIPADPGAYTAMPGYGYHFGQAAPILGNAATGAAPRAIARSLERPRSEVPPSVAPAFTPPLGTPPPTAGYASASSGHAYQTSVASGAVGSSDDEATNTDDTRVEASRLRNPATTVPQGSVIQAVMETALDSTRAGFARAIVSRDVVSFDGTRVLIPKGSKLFGEYQADVSLGQQRALIQWRRLTRPDGAIVALDSPSADPLGRAGVRGKVNTHFFERFGGAILQSMLDLGVRAATREAAGDTVILALPGTATQMGAATTIQRAEDIKPTLKIRQGASVSVFVARDLDFIEVGG